MATRGWQHVTAKDLTARELRQAVAKNPTKYRNVRVEIDGHKFDSKREAAIYQELKLREKAGEIRNLELQVPFPLLCPNDDRSGYAVVAEYIADFVFEEWTGNRAAGLNARNILISCWKRVVADCKGGRNTQMFNLKKKWLFLQSGIEIREIR